MELPSNEELLTAIRGWVEIESQTADTEGVNAMLSLVDGLYGDLGAKVVRIPGESSIGDMLSISPAGAGDEPGILVLSHLDTVHARGTLQNLPRSIDGDRAYGPGTFDMKGGAYIAFAAFTELANANIEILPGHSGRVYSPSAFASFAAYGESGFSHASFQEASWDNSGHEYQT